MDHVVLPDGSGVRIRPGETGQQAWARAQVMYPEAFGIPQQHGFMGAAKQGLGEAVESGSAGIRSLLGMEPAEPSAPVAPIPGAWRPTTDEDVKNTKGFMPWLGAQFAQKVSEPIGSMVGRYAIPTAVGVGAAMLMPEAVIPAAIARGAGFIASDTPIEQGENLQEQQAHPELAAGQSNPVMTSLIQASLLPAFGALGARAMAYMKLMGPDLATTTKAVMEGRMTQEEAISSLNSTAKNMLVKTGEAAAVGAPMMVGTEALRMNQAGEDPTSPEAISRYGQDIEAAGALSPILGVLGGRGRGAQERAVGAAGKQWAINEAPNKAYNDSWDEAVHDNAVPGNNIPPEPPIPPAGTQFGLDIPGQPDIGAAPTFDDKMAAAQQEIDRLETLAAAQKESGDIASAKQTLAEQKAKIKEIQGVKAAKWKSLQYGIGSDETPEDRTLTRADFNAAGVPNSTKGAAGELRAFTGQNLSDPTVMAAFRNTVERHTTGDTDATNWLTAKKAAKLRNLVGPESATGSEQQEIEGLPTAAESKQQAIMQRVAGQRWIPDIFTGHSWSHDMSRPEVEPAEVLSEFQNINEALYAKFQKANEQYQKTGDDTALNAILAEAKEKLAPLQTKWNQASTQKLFDAKGNPTERATRYEPQTESKNAGPGSSEDAGAGDAVPIQRGEGPRGAESVPGGVDTRIPNTEFAAAGEKPEQPPLDFVGRENADQIVREAPAAKTRRRKAAAENVVGVQKIAAQGPDLGPALALTPDMAAALARTRAAIGPNEPRVPVTTDTVNHARRIWSQHRAKSKDTPTYKDLAGRAKDRLHAMIDAHRASDKETTAPKMLPKKSLDEVAHYHQSANLTDKMAAAAKEAVRVRETPAKKRAAKGEEAVEQPEASKNIKDLAKQEEEESLFSDEDGDAVTFTKFLQDLDPKKKITIETESGLKTVNAKRAALDVNQAVNALEKIIQCKLK